MRIGIYARESTSDTTKAPSITEQIIRGKQWALENGHDVIEVYEDNGYSGGDWKRPGWLKCINDAKRHWYNILWVWNQDRIARDTEQFLYFCRILDQGRCKIYDDVGHEYIDMSTLGGRVKHSTLAQAAEIFRLVTSEKVKQAYRRRMAEGKSWGRKGKKIDIESVMADYNKSKNGNHADYMGWRKLGKKYGMAHMSIKKLILKELKKESKQ